MLSALESGRLRVVLVSTRNPLNIGAVARAMSNFGFSHLRLVNPYEPSFQDARSAVGASAILTHAEVHRSVASAIADCTLVVGTTAVRHRDLQQPLKVLKDGAGLIRRHLRSSPVALLFGSEKAGLSNQDMSHCQWLMHIPTRGQNISMNLGQAVAVCLYELARAVKEGQQADKSRFAPADQLERITALWLEALHASGYVKPRASAVTEQKVRRMIRRLKLSSEDAELWLGMLRQVRWRLGSGQSGKR